MNTDESSSRKKRITVIGAGFSGLASAFYLSRAGFQVEVIEERERAGGLISTTKTSFGLVESAANGFLNSARVEELFGLLGLEVVPTLKSARRRYIFRRGFPRRWPLGLLGSLRLLVFFAGFVLWRPLFAPRPRETVRAWARRALGDEAGQYLVEAALQGIYAGDPTRMSATLLFGRFFDRRRPREPKPRHRGTVSTTEGMGQLIEKLRERLERAGVRFVFASKFSSFQLEPDHPVVVATSAHAASEILSELDPSRAEACAKVELAPIVSVAVAFRDPPEAQGFGCLFPPVEGHEALGVLMNNFIFPGRALKGFLETWIFGGARADRRQLMALGDQEMLDKTIDERQSTLGASGEHFGFRVTRWPRALPHYTVELEESVAEMRGLRRNVILIGNYLGDIGLARILERASRLPPEISARGEWQK